MSEEELSKLTGVGQEHIKSALHELKKHYEDVKSSLMVANEGNFWKLAVRERFLPLVQKIVTETELPKSVIETLAVIAFKHPILQSEVIKIRTNKAYEHLLELEKAGYITREKFSRTKKIKLTPKFFTYFDLPPEKMKNAFSGFEAVEKAIQDRESQIHGINKKHQIGELEVYAEPKEATEKEFPIDEIQPEPETKPEPVEIVNEEEPAEEEKPANPNMKIVQPVLSLEEASVESKQETQTDRIKVFVKKPRVEEEEEDEEEKEEKYIAPAFKDKELPKDPEKMIDAIIEKKADAIMRNIESDPTKGKKKDLLDQIYDETEKEKKDLSEKEGF